MEVTKLLERKDGIKYAIIPMKSEIQKGDCIAIIKLTEEDIKWMEKNKNQRNQANINS